MNTFSKIIRLLFVSLSYCFSFSVFAHNDTHIDSDARATYLGNEAVLVSTQAGDILFDPFFHKNYGSYQLVPEGIRSAIFAGDAPYDNVSAIVISHAHGDHFSAEDVLTYLKDHKTVKLIAPKQAVALVEELKTSEMVSSQFITIDLAVGDKPTKHSLGAIEIESVRIPHAGWPERSEISNLVHRVIFQDEISVIHMGDADPNDIHFKPHEEYWQRKKTNMAFPPYWFFTSDEGKFILDERINAQQTIGVHVPIKVPSELKESDHDYFSEYAEHRDITK